MGHRCRITLSEPEANQMLRDLLFARNNQQEMWDEEQRRTRNEAKLRAAMKRPAPKARKP